MTRSNRRRARQVVILYPSSLYTNGKRRTQRENIEKRAKVTLDNKNKKNGRKREIGSSLALGDSRSLGSQAIC